MGWIEPKTDWDPTKDRLNPESYNRIRNNLAVLGAYAGKHGRRKELFQLVLCTGI